MQNDGESFDLTLLEVINQYMLSEVVNVISELREPKSTIGDNISQNYFTISAYTIPFSV